MSAAAAVLPYVWAFSQGPCRPTATTRPPEPNLAFYRKYTEALLRRYVRMSLEAGRVPSLLGQEMFRAKVTHYRIASFEDVVIADLAVLKSQMKEVVGNGQPGRLAQLESRLLDHEKMVQRLKGIAAAFGAFLTVAHAAIDLLLARR
jgi:hypothetical protein